MNTLKGPRRKRWLRWINLLLVVYLLGGVAVYFFQDNMIFHPEKVSQDSSYHFSQKHKDITIAINDSYNMNVVQFLTSGHLKKGVVLYFHGNMKNISWYAAQADLFTTKGYEVWMIDYPGFGKSTGELTESILYDYAMQVYNLAGKTYPASQIILYGRSLGTGVACWLASKKSCSHLILETPYYSLSSLASRYIPIYPVSTLIKYKIPTYKYLSLVNAPVTIFHGTDDQVIPYKNAARLKTMLKPSDRFITLEGRGHNNIPDDSVFSETLNAILDR